jgi:hypothetical protein
MARGVTRYKFSTLECVKLLKPFGEDAVNAGLGLAATYFACPEPLVGSLAHAGCCHLPGLTTSPPHRPPQTATRCLQVCTHAAADSRLPSYHLQGP